MFTGPDPSDIVYPDKLIRVRVDRAVLRPEYLVLALGTSDARRQIESFGRTTAGNIGVNGSNVRSLEIVVPPLGEQRRIVAEVEALEIQVNQLRRLQSITAAAVDALLPAVLDRAFRGELV